MAAGYRLCGWHVRSEIDLPELLPWHEVDDPVDVEIRVGSIPAATSDPVFVLPHSRLWANNDFELNMDKVGRFQVKQGCRVLVEPAAAVMENELKAFLLGTVLGVLCHQRGLLPLHASAVRFRESAVLIAGDSGAGKSTLAAALGLRGHGLLTDDVAAIDPSGPRVLPAYPQRKLAPDVLDTLALPHDGLVTHRPGQVKYRVPQPSGFTAEPLMPAVIYILNRTSFELSGNPVQLSPVEAMAALNNMIYRRRAGSRIQSQASLFHSIGRLAQATPVYLVNRFKGASLDTLDRFAAMIESHALQHGRWDQ